MTITHAFEPYIKYCKVERFNSHDTLGKYRGVFTSWILPLLGNTELESLTRLDLLDFRDALTRKGLSAYRQYSVIGCLKSFLKFCRTVLKANCLDPAEIASPNRGTPEVDYLTNEEVQRVVDAIDIHTFAGLRLRAMVELLLSTGMRLSEALALDRDLFEHGAPSAEIVGKGKRKRTVFFSERSQYWIRQYLKRRQDSHAALFVTTGDSPNRWRREDISRFFVHLRVKARIGKRFTPHVLRHTFCTNLLFNGADITFIRDMAGHQDIQTTARYYLGKDKRKLQEVWRTRLDYGLSGDTAANVAQQRTPPEALSSS